MPDGMNVIYDNHDRPITYLRLSVTDRCNLRCRYCMPAAGINFLPRKELLTYEELERVIQVLVELGISKVRITGGEPFVRKDLICFLEKISGIQGLKKITLTTNGTLLAPYIYQLQKIGISSVNLSLDSLDPGRFKAITRRDQFDSVMESFYLLTQSSIPFKINTVVMQNQNIDDIIPLAELTRKFDVSVRFIEEMPFNGTGSVHPTPSWTYQEILAHLMSTYPGLKELPAGPHSTSSNYKVPGYRGTLGIIAAFSRTFCGTCNRIRLDSQGTLKTCLYDSGVGNIKDFIRAGASDSKIRQMFLKNFKKRAANGFEAERRRLKKENPIHESMSVIGG